MAKFLRTNGISHKIEEIIVNAKVELVIVSPYLKISNNLFERLKEKSDKGVRIEFIYGKSELSPAERRKVESLRTINLYYYENLHAKCYYNEKEMVITSMNLYEFSEKNNREMGVFISKNEDAQLFIDGVLETKSIITASKSIIAGKAREDKEEEASCEQNSTAQIEEAFDLKTVNALLLNGLKEKYPNQKFVAKDWSVGIVCSKFINENINLEILPDNRRWRIDLQLDYREYKIRKRVYDMLAGSYKSSIEAKFPAGTVNWGGQMKRIKIDVYNSSYPDFFKTNTCAVKSTLEYLRIMEAEIIRRVELAEAG